MIRTRWTLLTLGCTLGVSALGAQTPAVRAQVEALRDSLHTDRSGSAFAAATRPRAPEERLRSGFILLARGQRDSSIADLAAALDQFYEVTVKRPSWPYAWFGLGLTKSALARLGVREIRSPHQPEGTGWVAGAVTALARATRADSTFLPPVAALVALQPYLPHLTDNVEVTAALRRSTTIDPADPWPWIQLGRIAQTRRDYAGARDAFAHAAAIATPDAQGTIDLELARELFAAGAADSATRLFYAGASASDTASVGLYRHDLGLIADSAELRAWDSLPPEGRSAWLADFWAKRERASGRPAGTRLIEHYRRYRFAQIHYAELPHRIRQFEWDVPFRSPPAEIDDRGAVYVRHGKPDQTATYVSEGTPPNESWLYYRPEGNLTFHFAAKAAGWRLVTSPFAIGGNLSGVLESRMGLDPRLGTLSLRFEADSMLAASNARLGRSPTALGWMGQRQEYWIRTGERADLEGRAAIAYGMSTDDDPLRFDRELAPIVQAFGAGDPTHGRGQLLVAVSIPYDARLRSIPLPDGGVGYVTRLRVTSADDAGRITLDVDTLVRVSAPHPLTEGQFLTIVRSYPLPATGDQRVRIIIADSGRTIGAVRVVNGVPVADLSDTLLTLSDLIVGRVGSGVTWDPPGGAPIPLNPLNAWNRASDLELAFEVGGLVQGAPFRVRVAVGDITADTTRPPRSSAEFDLPATGVRTLVRHSLALRSLRPGKYLLTVTVTTGDRSVRRDRRITIVGGQ